MQMMVTRDGGKLVRGRRVNFAHSQLAQNLLLPSYLGLPL